MMQNSGPAGSPRRAASHGRSCSQPHSSGLSRRPAAAQQGDALPGRPADGGGGRGRDAPRRRGSSRLARASDDRRLVARRAARPGSASARRARPRPPARFAAGPQRQGRPPPRGRHGRVGLGTATAMADRAGTSCRSGRSSASSTARPAGGRGRGAAVRAEFRRLASEAGIRRRFAPHQLRHAHALELAREGVTLNIIQRQLGHANLGTTSIYLQGIDTEEIITAVRTRRAPMVACGESASASRAKRRADRDEQLMAR